MGAGIYFSVRILKIISLLYESAEGVINILRAYLTSSRTDKEFCRGNLTLVYQH